MKWLKRLINHTIALYIGHNRGVIQAQSFGIDGRCIVMMTPWQFSEWRKSAKTDPALIARETAREQLIKRGRYGH